MSFTGHDLVRDALIEIGAVNAVDPSSAEDFALGLAKLNKIVNNWNIDGRTVYTSEFHTYALTPALQPHTIGPAGTFNIAQRPVSIEDANLVLSASSRVPIWPRDKEWWSNLSDRTVTGAEPTDLYYDKAWPLGAIYLWPIPTVAYSIELLTRLVLSAFNATTAVTLPPGYQDALTLTLAESLVGPMRVPLPQMLTVQAAQARARVFAANRVNVDLITADSGLPTGGRGTKMNWMTREIV